MKSISNLALKSKKYIIFDMDGTLIDSIGIWNITDQKLIVEYGETSIDLDTIQIDRENFILNNQNGDIYLTYCEFLIQKYNLKISNPKDLLKKRWEISGIILEKEIDFKPYVVDVLKLFKQLGYTLILATMTTQIQLDIYTKKNQKMLNQINIEEIFDLIIKKEDVKNKKPNPEIYQKILNYYCAKPEECLIIEDSFTGVLASKNAGIECINIYDKYSDVDRDKINEIADYFINSYEDLFTILKSLTSKRLVRLEK